MVYCPSRDIGGIYNYYHNFYYNLSGTYTGRAYAAYNIGAYRGHKYALGSDPNGGNIQGPTPYYFPNSNINLGMFYDTYPIS